MHGWRHIHWRDGMWQRALTAQLPGHALLGRATDQPAFPLRSHPSFLPSCWFELSNEDRNKISNSITKIMGC